MLLFALFRLFFKAPLHIINEAAYYYPSAIWNNQSFNLFKNKVIKPIMLSSIGFLYFPFWFANSFIMCASLHTPSAFSILEELLLWLVYYLFAKHDMHIIWLSDMKLYCFGLIEAFPDMFLKGQGQVVQRQEVNGSWIYPYDSHSIGSDSHFWGRKKAECRMSSNSGAWAVKSHHIK